MPLSEKLFIKAINPNHNPYLVKQWCIFNKIESEESLNNWKKLINPIFYKKMGTNVTLISKSA